MCLCATVLGVPAAPAVCDCGGPQQPVRGAVQGRAAMPGGCVSDSGCRRPGESPCEGTVQLQVCFFVAPGIPCLLCCSAVRVCELLHARLRGCGHHRHAQDRRVGICCLEGASLSPSSPPFVCHVFSDWFCDVGAVGAAKGHTVQCRPLVLPHRGECAGPGPEVRPVLPPVA